MNAAKEKKIMQHLKKEAPIFYKELKQQVKKLKKVSEQAADQQLIIAAAIHKIEI